MGTSEGAAVHFSSTLGGGLGTICHAFLAFLGSMLVGLVVALVLIRLKAAHEPAARPVTTFLVLLGAGLVALVIATWLYAPKGVDVAPDRIVVVRSVSPVVVSMAEVTGVKRAGTELDGAVRTFGVGGLWGSYGRFRSPALGSFLMYATNEKNAVVLSGTRTVVVTPDRPDDFVAAVERQLRNVRRR